MFIKSLTVTELNQYVKKILENDFILRNVLVEGEISNCKIHTSGHAYFSLKDSGGKINCVMFRGDLSGINFKPEDGMKVKVKGRVSLYEKEGKYQFYIREMSKEGEGELFAKYLKLKSKLEAKGMFDPEKKKTIPVFSRNVGVVTSGTGAALQDVISVATRRNKGINIYISPCLVQGIKAPESIINAIDRVERIPEVEVIIITRGGGSLEELWAFNDEKLAQRIKKCKKPVISAVGHETDFTIADFVSDLRVPTPSAAAEVAVFDSSKYSAILGELTMRLDTSMDRYVERKFLELSNVKEKLFMNSPTESLKRKKSDLKAIREKLQNIMGNEIEKQKEQLGKQVALLNSYNPLNVLQKGYSIIQNQEGQAITKAVEIHQDEDYKIILAEDRINARIIFNKE